MATMTQIDRMQEGVLAGLPLPLTFRPAVRMTDQELIAVSQRNRPYQIERDAKGLAWLIDPFAATVSVCRADESVEVLAQLDLVEAGRSGFGISAKSCG